MPAPVSATRSRSIAASAPAARDGHAAARRACAGGRSRRGSRRPRGSGPGRTETSGRSSGASAASVTLGAGRGRRERRDHLAARGRPRSVGSGWSGSVPPSASASVRRSSTSRSITRVSSTIAARCASSAGWTPSTIASRLPRMTASGVRSSWLTSARSERRSRSSASSRSGHRVERVDQIADAPADPRVGRLDPGAVVAGLDGPRRLHQPVQRPPGPPQAAPRRAGPRPR